MGIQAVSSGMSTDQILAQSQQPKASAKTSQVSQAADKDTFEKASGSPPVAPVAPAKPAVASAAAGSSTSSPKIYDKRDLNKDGKVTNDEKIKYAMKHPTAGGGKSSKASASQVNQGLSAYQQTPSQGSTSSTSARA